MTKRIITLTAGTLVLGAAALTLEAAPKGVTAGIHIATDASLRAVVSASGNCQVDCYQPHTCDDCEHKAPEAIPGSHWTMGGSHSGCNEGNCETSGPGCAIKHPLCVTQQEVASVMTSMLAEGRYGVLDLSIATVPGVGVHWEEQLMTFRNCVDRVMVSVALTDDEVTQLALLLGDK